MVKRAVLVGCNYPGSKAELQGCINDVNRLQKSLTERFGFSKSDINVLIDTDSSYPQPTGANVKSALQKLVANAKPGDVLFFHFSGHGVRVPAETGQSDDTGYDECIVPCDMNLITDDDIRELVDKVPKGVLFTLISDSCHSGGLINNAKEQIGESSRHGGSVAVAAAATPAKAPAPAKPPAKKSAGAKRELGFTEGLKSFVSGKIHGALEDQGISTSDPGIGNGAHEHLYKEQDEHFQNVPYEGEGYVKSRSLPISTLIEMLKEKTGREDLDVGTIRPSLFHVFREQSSSKVKAFVKVMMQGMHSDSDDGSESSHNHDIRGAVGALAHRFLKHKLDEEENGDEYLKPAMQIEVTDRKAAYAGGKAAGKVGGKAGGKAAGPVKASAGKAGGAKAGGKAESKEEKSTANVVKDMAVLITGCQSHETSADANSTGKEGDAYGAMSNALQAILSQQKGPITNQELVTKLREMLQKQGFSQHPGLYCSDENAAVPFIC